MNFLLDENVDPVIGSTFARQATTHLIWIVGDPIAPPRGTPDAAILRWCETYDFILVTYNRSTMPVHLRDHLAAGGHAPGISMLRPDMTIKEIVEELLFLAEAAQASELSDQITYLPI